MDRLSDDDFLVPSFIPNRPWSPDGSDELLSPLERTTSPDLLDVPSTCPSFQSSFFYSNSSPLGSTDGSALSLSVPKQQMNSNPILSASMVHRQRRKEKHSSKQLGKWDAAFPFSFAIGPAETKIHYVDERTPPSSSENLAALTGSPKRATDEMNTRAPPQKRSRQNSSTDAFIEDEEYSSEDNETPNAKLRGDKNDNGIVFFACPFYRKCPMHHLDCVNRKLSRVRDVKQHIQRRHTLNDWYCPTCYETFSSSSPRDRHIRFRHCDPRAPSTVSKVSEDAQKRLKQPLDRSMSAEDQWYSIWEILFGKGGRPKKAHLGTMVEETAGMMRKFWKQEGSRIIPGFLERKGETGCDEKQLGKLLVDLFDEVHRQFKKEARESQSASQPEDSWSTTGPLSSTDGLTSPFPSAQRSMPTPASYYPVVESGAYSGMLPAPALSMSGSTTTLTAEGLPSSEEQQGGQGDCVDLSRELSLEEHFSLSLKTQEFWDKLDSVPWPSTLDLNGVNR